MILKAFQLVIRSFIILTGSLFILYSGDISSKSCHDNYAADSFEEADYDLVDFIDEYFTDTKLPFLPTANNALKLGFVAEKKGKYIRPDSYQKGGGGRNYPYKPGIWKIVDFGNGVTEIHLLIQEPKKMAETQAFNTYNDLLGEPFSDYDAQAYIMTLQPEDARHRYSGRYFTVNVLLFGLHGDATELPRTVADVIFTDYTKWTKENSECKKR